MSDHLRDAVRSAISEIIASSPEPPPFGQVVLASPPAMRPTRLRPILVAVAAAVIVLLAIGGFALLVNRSDSPVVNSTTTLPTPTTTLAPTTSAPTTTTVPTTTTEVAAPLPVITWTRIDDPVFDGPTDQSGVSVRHIGSAFYVVGNDLENKSGVIWRSEDGYTWERFDDPAVFGGPPGVHEVSDIAGNDSIIVALGWEGNEANLDLGDVDHPPYGSEEAWCRGVLWVSEDDGHTWTRRSNEEAFGTGDGFCEVGSVLTTSDGFIAAYHGIWTSQDLLHWTETTELADSGVIEDLASTPSGIVAVGLAWEIAEQSAAWWSADGTDWTRVSDEDGQFEVGADLASWLTSVVSTERGLVAVGTAGPLAPYNLDAAVWLSTDGHTWRRMRGSELNGFHNEVMRDVTAVGDLLIAVGEASDYPAYWPQPLPDTHSMGVVWISEDDGATWHRMDNPGRVFGTYSADWISLRSVATSGDQLVAAGYDGKGVAVWTGTIEKGEGQ